MIEGRRARSFRSPLDRAAESVSSRAYIPTSRHPSERSAKVRVKGQGSQRRRRQSCTVSAKTALFETEIGINSVTAPFERQPRGIVHFLGGAFAGAAPQLAYQFLIRRIAEAGYTTIATPYAVTFRHLDCAAQVQKAFLAGFKTGSVHVSTAASRYFPNLTYKEFRDTIAALSGGSSDWTVGRSLPVHGVGHSNGALLHLLINSKPGSQAASNVIISYNNKEVKEAIPVPLDGLQSLIRNARSSPFRPALPTTEALLESAITLSAATRGVLDRRTATALRPALDQVGSILDEVEAGLTDFVPRPGESRSLISAAYVTRSTLLLRYADDGIDETRLIAPLLQRPSRESVVVKTLPGSHVSPCGGDVTWEVGRIFTPVDALALAAKAAAQTDLRRTARAVVQWLDAHSPAASGTS